MSQAEFTFFDLPNSNELGDSMEFDESFPFFSNNILVPKWTLKRNKGYSEAYSTEYLWDDVVNKVSNSIEIHQNLALFKEFFNSKVVETENERFEVQGTVRRILGNWKNNMPQRGCIPSLLGFLRLLGFNTTSDSIGPVFIDDGNSVTFDLSLTNVNYFCGRQKEMIEIHKQIIINQLNSNKGNNPSTNIILITGPFGIGKSELARYFGNKFKEFFDGNIICINAENHALMKRSFKSLADLLGIQMFDSFCYEKDIKLIVHECYKHFEWTESLWIFDNAISFDGNDGIQNFLPSTIRAVHAKTPVILITSRNREFPINIHQIVIDTLKPEDAIELLAKELAEIEPPSKDLKTLASELGNFTLLLKHASTYIRNEWKNNFFWRAQIKSPIQEYLEKYGNEDLSVSLRILSDDDEFHFGDYHRLSLLKFFKLFLNDMLKFDHETILNPQESVKCLVLGLIGFGSAEHLPKLVFLNLTQGTEKTLEITKILRILLNQNIVRANAKGTVCSAHRGVQKLIRVLLGSNGKLILTALVPLICKYLSSVLHKFNFECIQQIRDSLPTLESINKYLLKFNLLKEDGEFSISEFASCLHTCYMTLNFMEESWSYAKTMLDKLKEFYGESDRPVITMKCRLAQSFAVIYQIDKAKEILESLWGTSLNSLGRNDPLTLQIGCELAFMQTLPESRDTYIHHRKVEFIAAEKIYNEVIEYCQDNPQANLYKLKARWGLAILQKCLGDHNCIPVFEELLNLSKEQLQPNHSEIWRIRYFYTLACVAGKYYEKALESMVVLAEEAEKTFGLQHIRTAGSYIDMAEILISMKKYKDAKQRIEIILPYAEKVFGSTHFQYLRAREHISDIKRHFNLHTLDQALEVEKDILNIKLNCLKLPEASIHVIHTKERIGKLYYEKNELDKSLEFFKQVYKTQKIIWKENLEFTKQTKSQIDKITQEMANLKLSFEMNSSNKVLASCSRNKKKTNYGSNPWKCEYCPTALKTRKTLHQHYRRKHDEGPPLPEYRCTKCHKLFKGKYDFLRHLREGTKHFTLYGPCLELV